jgi:CheY-like chemotaxis protein
MKNMHISPALPDAGHPSGIKTSMQDAIEVRLWEIYLLRSRTNINHILSSYSLDKGLCTSNMKDPERVCFRFLKYDWEKSLRDMLVCNNIPCEIVRHFKVDVFREISKKKVYVAEDELNTLFALNSMLEDAGYDVIVSHCGYPLMEHYLPATDLFILDKGMPDIDGIELCQHLRAQPATRAIPIVMISASRNFVDKALKAGVNDCLEKPFDMKDLLELASKHTRRNPHHHIESQGFQ